MKVVNQCKKCGSELSAAGLCSRCTSPTSDTGILIPFTERPRQKSVAQISTICGVVLVLLTLAVGGAYTFHKEIINAVRGVQAPDPEAARLKARESVDETLKRLGKNGTASQGR